MIAVIVGETLKSVYIKYALGLLLCVSRKTCVRMGAALNEDHDVLNRALKSISKDKQGLQKSLLYVAYKLLNPKRKWWCVLDDSMLLKPHTKKLAQAILDYCGATGKIDRGLVSVFLCITDGEIVIPISYKFWLNKKSCTPESYRKKWEIGVDLLRELPEDFKHKSLLMDGAYANRFSLQILVNLGFEFEARFRRNGIVTVNDQRRPIADHLNHLVVGPRIYAMVKGSWQGHNFYFTAHKHRNRSGEYVITYTISNRVTSASEHAKNYCLRWVIEMFFRTSKQSLGIQDCASTNIDMQIAHINSCIITYAFLQRQRIKYKLSCVEDALYLLRDASKHTVMRELQASDYQNMLLRNSCLNKFFQHTACVCWFE